MLIIRKDGSPRRARRHSLTIMIVPGTGEKAFNINLSPAKLRRTIISGVMFGGILFFLIGFSVYSSFQMAELERIRTVNQQQEQQIMELQAFTSGVQSRVERVKELDRQIRRMVGLEDKESSEEPNNGRMDVFEDQSQKDVSAGRSRQAFKYFPSRSGSTLADNASERSAMAYKGLRSTFDLDELKSSLQTLDGDIERQQDGLYKLEKDITARLDYLSSVPSTYPVRGPITSPFGTRRSPFGWRTEFHSGLDIGADYGATVRASAKGEIVFTGWKPGLGRVIEVNHGHGFVSAYCHLSAININVGDKVERGDQIGKVGNSGRSTGPHLHFMVYKDGQLQDPQTYLVH